MPIRNPRPPQADKRALPSLTPGPKARDIGRFPGNALHKVIQTAPGFIPRILLIGILAECYCAYPTLGGVPYGTPTARGLRLETWK